MLYSPSFPSFIAYLSTGKSTFGMSLALEQGILKCISTDTVRAVMRSYVPESISPPLHRSSYASSVEDGTDDAVKSWKETCKVLESSLDGLVEDAIKRGVSLVLEGVSIEPSRKWIDRFTEAGGKVLSFYTHTHVYNAYVM